MASLGALPPTMEMLEDEHEMTRLGAIQMIHELARRQPNRPKIVAFGGIPHMVSMITEEYVVVDHCYYPPTTLRSRPSTPPTTTPPTTNHQPPLIHPPPITLRLPPRHLPTTTLPTTHTGTTARWCT